jgi:hypothetical protein
VAAKPFPFLQSGVGGTFPDGGLVSGVQDLTLQDSTLTDQQAIVGEYALWLRVRGTLAGDTSTAGVEFELASLAGDVVDNFTLFELGDYEHLLLGGTAPVGDVEPERIILRLTVPSGITGMALDASLIGMSIPF